MINADVQPPTTYSPTIMPLTFSLFLQLATISKFKMATMNIKSAYLNAPLQDKADWITTTLEPHIAEVCGLDLAQEYRNANALYGLPDSGRIFYLHYNTAEEYIMSKFDNCLFYKISAAETTYIIFSNTDANIESVITSTGKHYAVTLDRDATSFLGLNLALNADNTMTVTQPKLLTKLFALHPPPPQKRGHNNRATDTSLPSTPQRHRSEPHTNRPIRVPPSPRHAPIYHEKQTRHHGGSILRRDQELLSN